MPNPIGACIPLFAGLDVGLPVAIEVAHLYVAPTVILLYPGTRQIRFSATGPTTAA